LWERIRAISVARDCAGTISGGTDGAYHERDRRSTRRALSYRFTGKLEGDRISGALDMGEYLGAKWTATRHAFGG